MTYPGTKMEFISLNSMSVIHLRRIKARLLLSIKKIGWFESMGIEKVSVSFN